MRKVLFSIFLVFLFTGCVVQGLYSDYNKLSENEREKIVDISDKKDISDLKDFKRIYLITPENLKLALSKNERNVIYLWNPFCSATSCISPSIAKRVADERGYKFWLITDSFLLRNANFDFPIYAIKESLQRKTRAKYVKNFAKELGCGKYDFELFIVYDKNEYLCYDNIEDIPT